jgi:hypothetical protein
MTDDLRKRLAKAQASEHAALAELDKAQEALQRGQSVLAAQEREMSAFSDLDGAVAKHRASEIRAGASASAALPGALSKRIAARAALAADIESYRTAVEELAADCKREEAKVSSEREAGAEIVRDILVAEGEALASRIIALETEAFGLRQCLQALGRTYLDVGGSFAQVPFSRKMLESAARPYTRFVFDNEHEPHMQAWAGYRDRLAVDASATLDTAVAKVAA